MFDVSALLKTFLRDMPDPLLTSALYSGFIQAAKIPSDQPRVDCVLGLCLKLPELNLHTLIYLMAFLKRMTLAEKLNKMNSFNLAVCIGPNIIYNKANKNNDGYINEERIVAQILIENGNAIGRGKSR